MPGCYKRGVMLRFALAVAAPVAAALVVAAPLPAAASMADAAFTAGRWEAVTTAGRAERTADSLALSARALLVRAAYVARSKPEALALIAEAERDAAAALAIDPRNRVALLQQAAAVGYRARFERSLAKAHAGRDQLRALTRSDPEWASGWLALALWHGEAVSAAGRLLAQTALGANLDAMSRDFARATALDPASPVTPASQGLLLIRLGEGRAAESRRLLEQAQRAKPRDAYEALLQRHAAQVLAELDAGSAKRARERANALAAFAGIAG